MCRTLLFALFTMSAIMIAAQTEKKKTEVLTPTARLAAAKTAFISKVHGSTIPFDVISSSLEGWGRFTLVNAPEKADIVIEITAPEESSGVSVSSSTKQSPQTGRMEPSSSSSKQLSFSSDVKVAVLDSRTRPPLWSAIEHIKNSMKKKDRENNLVEASQRLFSKLHDQIEPPVSK